jgi:putative inorganic carbon (HCO3(-)) transporter
VSSVPLEAPRSRSRTLDLADPRLAAAVFIPIALATGVVFAHKPVLGLALVLALGFATLVMLDLPLALILYVPLTFLQTVKFPGIGPSLIGLVILAAWLGAARSGIVRYRDLFASSWTMPALLVVFLLWNAATIIWAPNRGLGLDTLLDWSRALLLFVLLITTIRTVRDLRLLMIAFVFGAVLAILASVLTGSLQTAQTYGNRLTGAAGDPNYLAAGILAAAVLAIALIATSRRWLLKLVLMAALVTFALAFAATESRGGILGLAGATVCALVLFPRRRLAILGALVALAAIIGIFFAANPAALSRVTHISSSGDGRSDLWTVALRAWHDHVVAGVGLNNFLAVEAHYVNRPGALTSLALIVDHPHVVHNVYLEALVDTGIIGAAIFLALVGRMLSTAWAATRSAVANQRHDLDVLSRALVAAIVGVLISLFFLSDGPDTRFWILFSMGPILFKLANAPAATDAIRQPGASAQAPIPLA